MNILQKILLIVAVITGSFMYVGMSTSVHAQVFSGSKQDACKGANLDASNADCKSNAATNRIEGIVKAIINLISIIVGIVAIILIIINGLRFITANGDSNSISSARSGVIYALVGLIIAALAQVIVRFVLARF